MYLFCLLYFLSHILAVESHTRIYFVTDKTIKKIFKDDGTELTDLELKENANGNDLTSKFIWDQHNLKPEFYFIECQAFLSSNSETKLLLKCLSYNNEEIFKFEIECKNGKLLKVNFYDIDGNPKRIIRFKEKEHAYLVSSREENVNSIWNSLKYMRKVPNIRSSCHVIIGKFNEHIRTVKILRDKTIGCFEYDKTYILKIWEVEKYVLKIVNTLLKTLSNLSIPSSNKLEFVEPYDNFKKKMRKFYKMIKSLKDTYDLEFLRNKEKGKEYRFSYQKKFGEDAEIILEELESDSSNSIDQKYKILYEDLESLDLLVNKSTDMNEANDQITIDCDIKIVDKFVEKYSLRLLEYCNILINYDEVFLSENYYRRNKNKESQDFTALENAYDDILIARELKKYILNYQNDKTDFLIFFQTDYFRNKLSEKIKVNLENFKHILLYKNITLRVLTRNIVIHVSDDCIERISKLQKDFKSVFNSEDSSTAQTFETIITNLEYNPVQNDITPSRNGSDDDNQNVINGQSGLNNDENQGSIQTGDQPNLDGNQNTNTDQTNLDDDQDTNTAQTNLGNNQDTNIDQTNLGDNQDTNNDQPNLDENRNNNTDQPNLDINQESLQTNEQTNLDGNQSINNDQPNLETKSEENSNSLGNNISKDETKEPKTEISSTANHTDNKVKREKGQESNKDIEVADKREKGQDLNKDIKLADKINYNESKDLKDDDKENVKILHYNEQNPKDNSNRTNNKIDFDENYESNNQRSDRPGQSKAENKTFKNELNTDEGKKTIERNKVNDDVYPKETNEKQDVKSTFLKNNSIFLICCLAIASIVIGVSIYYFRSSQ